MTFTDSAVMNAAREFNRIVQYTFSFDGARPPLVNELMKIESSRSTRSFRLYRSQAAATVHTRTARAKGIRCARRDRLQDQNAGHRRQAGEAASLVRSTLTHKQHTRLAISENYVF